jgi:hypothetical protein
MSAPRQKRTFALGGVHRRSEARYALLQFFCTPADRLRRNR